MKGSFLILLFWLSALPGIPVKVSKGYIVRVNGSTEEQGVLPDVFIKDHLLDENDEILDGLLEKMEDTR